MVVKRSDEIDGELDRRIPYATKSRNLNYPSGQPLFNFSPCRTGGDKNSVDMYPGISRDPSLARFITLVSSSSELTNASFTNFLLNNYRFLYSLSSVFLFSFSFLNETGFKLRLCVIVHCCIFL